MTPKYNVYVSDEREGNRKGFISQQEILEYVSEEEIFELVFGYNQQNMFILLLHLGKTEMQDVGLKEVHLLQAN